MKKYEDLNIVDETLLKKLSGGGGGTKLPDYSTTAHKTGRKWIDGKDIYEISIVKENFEISSNINFDVVKYADINCDKVLKGHVYSSVDNGGGNLDVWESDNDYIRGKSNTSWVRGTITITIEYTQQS